MTTFTNKFTKKPIAMALGAAFALNGLAVQAASQGAIFQAADLPSGYTLLAEGKCGEGKCGAEKKAGEGKCGEGKCGAEAFKKMDKDADGKLTLEEFMAGHKAAEGKCGEGKCGAQK
ncbi:MAG: HvfA family oxazolone/thioamide-modified RiPP metallophore [Nevskiales bacterium]